MSPSPPYRKYAPPLSVICLVLFACAIFLAANTFMRRLWITCGIDVILAVNLGFMFRYWSRRTAIAQRQRLLLRIDVRDTGPSLAMTFHMTEVELARAEQVLMAAQAALDRGRAELESNLNEMKMRERRHVP